MHFDYSRVHHWHYCSQISCQGTQVPHLFLSMCFCPCCQGTASGFYIWHQKHFTFQSPVSTLWLCSLTAFLTNCRLFAFFPNGYTVAQCITKVCLIPFFSMVTVIGDTSIALSAPNVSSDYFLHVSAANGFVAESSRARWSMQLYFMAYVYRAALQTFVLRSLLHRRHADFIFLSISCSTVIMQSKPLALDVWQMYSLWHELLELSYI